jgi:hypothetical protein
MTPAPQWHIETRSGKYVNPFDVDPYVVCVEDVAFALSNECRFGGHHRWCVADHSRAVERAVASRGASVLTRMHAILHDAHEYVLKDLPNPMKHRPDMIPYRDACDRAQIAILHALNVPQNLPNGHDLVKRCDTAVMILVAERGLESRGRGWTCSDEATLEFANELRGALGPMMWMPWDPVHAEAAFLESYYDLKASMKEADG